MNRTELFINKLKEANPKLGIELNPPASDYEIENLEDILNSNLPSDLRKFYRITNGFETNDNLFRILPIEEVISHKGELPSNQIYFAEYMIYSDTWEVVIDPINTEEYKIINSNHKKDKEIILTNNLLDFLERYLENGIFGDHGLFSWYDDLKNK